MTFFDSLSKLIDQFSDVLINEIVDDRGYTILHEACFHNHERIARFLITVGQRTLKAMELTNYCNYKTE